MKKIVVFGATGNLGAYISVHMKEQGYDVIAVGHRKNDNNFFADRGMSYYSVDIKDPKAFDILPKDDIYAVAHFASSLPSRYAFDPIDLFESITIGTLNVLKLDANSELQEDCISTNTFRYGKISQQWYGDTV